MLWSKGKKKAKEVDSVVGLWEGKGRRRMREFAIEASSSATSMMVGTLVEDRKGGGGGEEDLGRRAEETEKKERE